MFRAIVRERVYGRAGEALAGLAIGAAAAIAAVAIRALLVPLTGLTAPFVMNFIAAVLATLFAGWRAGTVAVAAGQVLAWYFLLEPRMSFSLLEPRDAGALALSTVAQLCLVAVIGRYQYEIDRAHADANHEHELRKLLLFELKHRVKNTLALVQSLAQQTFHSHGVDELAHTYYRRLNALSQTHDLLTQSEWAGTDIRSVIEHAVHSLVPNRTRFTTKGPFLVLEPKGCLNIALVFHELTTNSVKYGALSNSSGRVSVVWRNDPKSGFELSWQESGGPPVSDPKRRGFGTKLIKRAMASELNANVELHFDETGLSCVVKAPYIVPSSLVRSPGQRETSVVSNPESVTGVMTR